MFDARSIFDILVGGGGRRRQGQPSDPTVFKDMLDQLGNQDSPTTAGGQSTAKAEPQQAPGGRWGEQRYPQPSGAPGGSLGPGGGMSLDDILRSVLGGGIPRPGQPTTASAQPPQQGGPQGAPEISTELQDLLRQILQGGVGGAAGAPTGAPAGTPSGGVKIPINRLTGEQAAGAEGTGQTGQPGEPGLIEGLRQILGQATAGAREGAERIDEATGLSAKAREAVGQATGQTPEELVARLRELIANNQLASGAALGGLGALVLGTRAGRSLAATAARLGGLALIGGLAYKAFQNYQQGRPILSPQGETKPQTLIPAPEGSGFEAQAVTHDSARRYIRAMIAAAAADGRIDANEQQRILGGLRQAGLDDPAQQFLAAEVNSPATVSELAAGVTSPEEALQVYTAARIAVDADKPEEHAFLSALAQALGIDDDLARQVDAAARGAT
jgi:uncharacterized membrane protein YebE (DUF533 family)